MQNKYFIFFLLIFSTSSISEDSESLLDKKIVESISKKISLVLPEGSKIETVEKSEFPGIYKVYFGDIQPIYVSEDGTYFLYGSMFKIKNGDYLSDENISTSNGRTNSIIQNLTDLDISSRRLSLMEQIDKNELISFEAENQLYDLIVFTDVDCGYCRKLHNEIKEYNELGITIRYAAFPRSGLGTETFSKMVGAWCSNDKSKVITELKNGKKINLDFCDSQPVAKHYAIGKKLGITGTPAIIDNKGELLPGYLSPADLLQKLKG